MTTRTRAVPSPITPLHPTPTTSKDSAPAAKMPPPIASPSPIPPHILNPQIEATPTTKKDVAPLPTLTLNTLQRPSPNAAKAGRKIAKARRHSENLPRSPKPMSPSVKGIQSIKRWLQKAPEESNSMENSAKKARN